MPLQSSNSGYEETISLYSLLPFKELLSLVKKNRVKESSDYVVHP